MRDAWRLAVGTLTAIPVTPPSAVTPRTARTAMLLAPVAVLPLGVLVTLVCLAGDTAALPPLVTALVAVGVLAAGSRALHWDGLSDVADGLTVSYDRTRSLEVMKSGTSGPAGVVATVVVLGVQVAALAPLTMSVRGAAVAGLAVCLSRGALAPCCARGVPGARPDGLGTTYVGVVPVPAAVLTSVAVVGLAGAAAGLSGAVGALVAAAVVAMLLRRATTRFGGVTGDVFGAAIELALAALLVGAAAGGLP